MGRDYKRKTVADGTFQYLNQDPKPRREASCEGCHLPKFDSADHMPWFQANREYDDGYNAGIAAAACLLKRKAEALADNDWLWARHKQEVLLTAAGEVLGLMRPGNQVAPRSE